MKDEIKVGEWIRTTIGEVGQVYLVEVSGERNHFLSIYKNINKIVE